MVRKMQRTPWHRLTQEAGDRRVFSLWCSCCTVRAWSSFLPLLQAVSSMYKTRNQLFPKREPALPTMSSLNAFVHTPQLSGNQRSLGWQGPRDA